MGVSRGVSVSEAGSGQPAGTGPRVLVVGGGIAGLTCAYDLIRGGAEVTVLEADAGCGGALSARRRGEVLTDAGAEAFASQSRAVAGLIEELGLTDQLVTPNPAGAWLQLPELAAPLPVTGLLGIPGDPQAQDVVTIVGEAAAARAAEDLQASVEPWRARAEAVAAGEDRISLAELVTERMGPAVVERLVTPVVSGVHSAAAEALDVEAVAPGLVGLMLEEGSLARAVTARRAQAPAGSAVQSLQGGMHTLITALTAQVAQAGATIHTSSLLNSLTELAAGSFDDIILAVDAPEAARLTGLTWGERSPGEAGEEAAGDAIGPGVALVTLLLETEALNDSPRGTGMLIAPSVTTVFAKAMTHVTSKWAWAAEALGESRHLVRLSYGRIDDEQRQARSPAHSTDEQLIAEARRDIAVLFGIPGLGEAVQEADVVRWRRAVPLSGPEHAGRAAELRRRLTVTSGPHGERLHAVGAWFAGTGLSKVVPDARRTAAEVLRQSFYAM